MSDAETLYEQRPRRRCNLKWKCLEPQKATFMGMFPLTLFCFSSNIFDSQGTNMALPKLQNYFHMSETTVQWALTVYYLAQASLSIPLAKVSQKMGEIKALYLFTTIITVFSIFCAIIDNFYFFLLSHFLVGVGTSGQIVSRNSIIRKLVPPDKVQRYILYQNLMMGVIQIILPVVCGVIIDYDWTLLYYITAGMSVMGTLFLIPYPNLPGTRIPGKRFDYGGFLTLFLAIITFNLVFTVISYKIYWLAGIFCVLSAGSFVGFYYIEKKVSDPIFPLRLMQNPLSDLFIINFIGFFNTSGLLYLLPYLMDFHQKNSKFTGYIKIIVSFLQLLVSVLMLFVTKRLFNKTVIVVGLSGMMVTIVLQIAFSYSLLGWVICHVIHNGFYTFSSILVYPNMLLSVDTKFANQVSAIPTTSRTVSQSMTLSVTAMVMEMTYRAFGGEELSGKDGPGEPEESQQTAYRNSMMITQSIFLALNTVSLVVAAMRLGQMRSDFGKPKFDPSKVRVVNIQEPHTEEMMSSKNARLFSEEVQPRDSPKGRTRDGEDEDSVDLQ